MHCITLTQRYAVVELISLTFEQGLLLDITAVQYQSPVIL